MWRVVRMISRFSSIDFVVERTDDVGARHHDLPRRPFRELEDAFDDLAVLLGENAGLLRVREDQAQLLLRVRHLRLAGRLDADERAGRAFVVRFSSQMTGYVSDVEARAADAPTRARCRRVLSMARYFGPSSPKMMCSDEMTMNATVAAIECATGDAEDAEDANRGWISAAKAGSPTQPSASDASVMPSCVAER